MVYESDFYTSRRPYSYSRPTVSSYSVTRRGIRSDEFNDFDEIEEEARERTAARVTSNKLKRLRQKIREGMLEAAACRRPPRPLVKVLNRTKSPEVQYRCFNVGPTASNEVVTLGHILKQNPIFHHTKYRSLHDLKHQVHHEVVDETIKCKKRLFIVNSSPFDRYLQRFVDDEILHDKGPSGSEDYCYDEQIREAAAQKFKQIERMRLKMHSAMANSHYHFESPERIIIKPPAPRQIIAPETMKKAHLKLSFRGTPLRVIPGISRVYSYSSYAPLTYHTLPYYSYYRSLPSTLYLPSAVPLRYYTRSTPVRVIRSPLRDYSPPRMFSVSVRPSVIHRELMRIEHKTRPRYGYDPTDEFLNSVHAKEFEDDIRSIRTETSRVLNRVHTPLPRGRRAVSCAPFSRYDSSVTTDREFLEHIRGVPRSVKDDIFTLSRYAEPARKYLGKSHLASVRICGDKGYPIRKPAYCDELYNPDYPSANRKVRNEVEYLSHYLKNRRAAESANEPGLDRFRPSRKFSAPRTLEDPNAEMKAKKAARADKLSSFNEVDEIDLEKIRAKRQAEAQLQEAKLAKAEAEEKQRQEAEARRLEAARRKAAEEKAHRDEEMARQAAEEEARRQAAEEEVARLEQAHQEAEEAARLETAEAARRVAEEQARLEAEELARLEAEELARLEAEELARLEAEEQALLEAEELARQAAEEQARLEAEEKARWEAEESARRVAEAQRLDEEAEILRKIETAAKAEREAELARQAGELVEIARLEAEALRLLEYEQAASELDQPLDQHLEHSQSTNEDAEALLSDDAVVDTSVEPVIQEPLTPAAAEDTREDFSEVHATAEETSDRTAGNAEPVTDDEVEPLE